MAIVSKVSSLFPNKALLEGTPDSKFTAGRTYTLTGTLTNAADDSNTSSYRICDLPSDCILDEATAFDVEAWGFAAVRIGTYDDVDALVTVAKSAGAVHVPKVFGDANEGKELWDMLGLPADPGGTIALYAHAVADATGAGSMLFKVAYRYN